MTPEQSGGLCCAHPNGSLTRTFFAPVPHSLLLARFNSGRPERIAQGGGQLVWSSAMDKDPLLLNAHSYWLPAVR